MKSPGIEIIEVNSNQHFQDFLRLPYLLNKNNACWVPPLQTSVKKILSSRQNPFWKTHHKHLFLAFNNGKPVGRIAAIYSDQVKEEGHFGYLDAVEDPAIFTMLLHTVTGILKDRGCRRVLGPFNPNFHQEMGILVEGFDKSPYLMLPHNQPYYDGMIQRAGFIKACDFFAFQLKIDQFNPNDKIVRVNRLLAERSSITLRNGNLKRFEYDAEVIRQIYNDAFSNHWGFTPISREDFDFMAKDLKTILDPDLVLIAEHQGEAVGFLLAVPNINQALYKIRNGKLYPLGIFKLLYYFKRINSFRVMLLGIKRKYQHLGLGSMFYLKLFENTFQSKFRNVEISWVAETNHTMLAAAKLLGAERVKTYRLYDKLI